MDMFSTQSNETPHALLVDLVHGCCPGSLLRDEPAADRRVFVLRGNRNRGGWSHSQLSACRSARVLDCASTSAGLFRFKQAVDELDLDSVRVVTTPRGRDALVRYQELLFTAAYAFTYHVTSDACSTCAGSAHTHSPVGDVQEEVRAFVQQLPALRGPITLLTSSLIPGECECVCH